LAQPPLYRIDIGKEVHWALDDEERDRIISDAAKNAKIEISRFKGLGEMTAEELRETTLDKTRRRALRVMVDGELEADRVFSDLMGKDPSARFQFIMEQAPRAEAVELDV
jgi:DNA gyrase subunit B